MPKTKQLEDAYRIPGFRPQPTLQVLFGDAHTRILTLSRLGKK